MSERKDAPAFPEINTDFPGPGLARIYSMGGLTQRQWFAGMVIQGLLNGGVDMNLKVEGKDVTIEKLATVITDNLIEELNK